MTDDEKDKIRKLVQADGEKLMVQAAKLYLGKFCPFANGECRGPECQVFLLTGDGGKITGGACSIPLVASQVGPIAAGLFQLAESNRPIARVIPGSDGQIR